MVVEPVAARNDASSPAHTYHTVSRRLIETAEKIIAIGLPVLYCLIAVAFYLKTYDSAQIKITLMQIGGTAIIAVWLIKLLEGSTTLRFLGKNLTLVLPLLAFLVSGILSYFRSPFPLASANELVRRVIYILFAVIIMCEINSEEKINRLLKWLYAAAFISTIYAVIQFLDYRFFPPPPDPGLDPFIWRQAFGDRVFSTFGNPNFFGDFLVVMSPITMAMYMRTRRFHLLVLWLLIAFSVTYTFSKGAWLGFGSGLLVFVFFAVGFFATAAKTKIRRILIGMTIATLLFVSFGIWHNLKGRPDSASFRLFTWISTWEMINTNPWLGTGIGTFYVTYPSWRRPQIFFIEGKHNTETDHPEDEYLEVWYDEGYVGFGIFLLLLAVYLTVGFRNLQAFSRSNAERPKGDMRAYVQLGILTAIIAQLIHNCVCVSLRFVSSGVMLWMLIGLIGSLNAHNPLPAGEPDGEETTRLPLTARRAMQALVAAVAFYFIWVFYGYFKADINHNLAIFYSKQAQWTPALEHYDTIMKENPSFIMAHYFMGNVFNDRWSPGDPERSIEKYRDVWKLAPNYVQSHHQAGLIYLKWGEDERRLAGEAMQRGDRKAAAAHEKKQKDLWNQALAQFELYRRIDPIFPLNYYRMAWIYMQLGQQDKAEAMYRAHLEYPEKLKQPPYNAWVEDWAVRRKDEYAETCVNLGNLYFTKGDLAGAEKYYQQALKLSPNAVNALKNLAILYGQQGKRDAAIAQWQKLQSIAPRDPDVQRVFQMQPVRQ
jgi:tetratricopeptide (TPR) repeat protein